MNQPRYRCAILRQSLFPFAQFIGNGKSLFREAIISEANTLLVSSKALTTCGWDDVPHLDEKTKAEMEASTPPHLRKARKNGEPSLGAGAIYPVDPDDFKVDPFPIPKHWKRCYAMDVGWKKTAVVWGAIDPDTGILYLYSEHYRGQAEPIIHAQAIKARGPWIPGVIDPAARGRSQIDGQRLFLQYTNEHNLQLSLANNAVEAGIYAVWELLSIGMMKVFSSLSNWFAEFRIYRRNEKGVIVKENDHLMDATRYLVMSALQLAIPTPVAKRLIGSSGVADTLAGY